MKISLKNNKSFEFENENSIYHVAESSGLRLEHSFLIVRCRSSIAKVYSEKTVINKNSLNENSFY